MHSLPVEPSTIATNETSSRIGVALFGLLLLIPCFFIAVQFRLLPAVDTFNLSQMNMNIMRDQAEFVGMENYEAVLTSPLYLETLQYTQALLITRVSVIAIVPLLLGLLAGLQPKLGRMVTRVILSVAAVLAAPVSFAVLWTSYWSPIWGSQALPDRTIPEGLILSSPVGAVNSTLLLDALLTLMLGLAIGVPVYMAVMRGRHRGSATITAIGIWFAGGVLAAASAFQSFTISAIVTGGGPLSSTTTLMYNQYQIGFQRFNFGPAAVYAVIVIATGVFAALMVWLVLTLLRLRIEFIPQRKTSDTQAGASLIVIPLLIMACAPLAALLVWAVQISGQAEAPLEAAIDWTSVLSNTVVPPLLAIWLVQIPVAYLAGLSLGLLRPFGRGVSSVLFLLLLIIVFIPTEGLILEWFGTARNAELLNTSEVLRWPWMIGGLSLLVFKLFFDGAFVVYQQAREQEADVRQVMLNRVFLPSIGLVLLIGAALTFISTQELLWPLIAISDREIHTLPLQLFALRGGFGGPETFTLLTHTASTGLLQIAAVAVPIFALLHIFVLERLALVSGHNAKPSTFGSSEV